MKALADLDYDELHARAVEAARLPALDGDDDGYAGLDVPDADSFAGYGTIAVTSDGWLRARANLYLRGLPDAPRPVDALRRLSDADREIVLVEALYEIDLERASRHLRAFDPSKHKRWLKPHPKAGKFRPMIDLLKEAILQFDPKKDKHPFELFDRPQLLKVAKDRGIVLKRGEDRDSIADKLLASFAIGKAKVAVPAKKAAGKVAKKAAPAKKKAEFKLDEPDRLRIRVLPFVGGPLPGKKESLQVRVNKGLGHIQIGSIHREKDDTWTVNPIAKEVGGYFKPPPKGANRDQAIKALLDAYDMAAAQKANPLVPKAAAAPNRRNEVKAKIAADKLEELDYLDLKDLALEHGVDVIGRPKEDIISDVRREIAARKVAAAKAAKAAKAKVPAANVPGPAGKFHRDVKGIEDLQRTVEGRDLLGENMLAGGAVGDTRIRKYRDGTKLVWKQAYTKHENDAEQLAALTARALGLEAPRIYRNDEKSVYMEFKEGKVAYNHHDVRGMIDDVPGQVADTRDGRMMGLLDLLIDNSDRHNGNWLIRSDGRYIPIDHGYAFAGRPGRRLPSPREAKKVRSGFAEHYYRDAGVLNLGMQWVPNDLSKQDVAEISQRLERLRPDFEHVGRGNWHRFMMERLDEIGKNANGTKSRLLPALV